MRRHRVFTVLGTIVLVVAVSTGTHAQAPLNLKQHNQILLEIDELQSAVAGVQESVDQLQPAPPEPPCGPDTFRERFVALSDTEVCDNATGFVWQRHIGDSDPLLWDEAIDHCLALGDGYHLPAVEQMLTVLDYSQTNPAFPTPNPFVFLRGGNYWSATQDFRSNPPIDIDKWAVDLGQGDVADYNVVNAGQPVDTRFAAWCVRNSL